MAKIWDRKSFEVGGHWPLWGGEKTKCPRRTEKKSNAKKNAFGKQGTRFIAIHEIMTPGDINVCSEIRNTT